MELMTNRYGETVPSVTAPNGVIISTPNYVASLSSEQKKVLINSIRDLKNKELIEAGQVPTKAPTMGELAVQTNMQQGLTKVEEALGMSESVLREHIWSRSGLKEQLLIKIQHMTGIEVVTREQLEEAHKLWLDHLFNPSKEQTERGEQGIQEPTKKRKSTTTRTKTKTSSASS